MKESQILTQEEIDKILSIKQNEDDDFVKLNKEFYSLGRCRFRKFFNLSTPHKEYIPYEIITNNPSISVSFNRFINKILVLDNNIRKLLSSLRFASSENKGYNDLIKKLRKYISDYKELVYKYNSLYDLRDDLLKNQRQR